MLSTLTLVSALVLAQPAPEGGLAAIEREQQALFDRIAPGVVYLSRGDAIGSGFFVSADGLILTNAHVVGDRSQVDVVLFDGRKARGEVVERAESEDLALVQVPLKGTPSLELGTIGDIRVGSWVAAVGHGRGLVWTFNSGMVSNIFPEGRERPVFQTEIPINPGNSGGPIFDRRGRVVGVVTAGIFKETNSVNFGYVIDVARKSLKKLSLACECLVIHTADGVPVFVNGAMAGTGPRLVIPAAANKVYEVFAVIGGKMKSGKATFPASRELTLK